MKSVTVLCLVLAVAFAAGEKRDENREDLEETIVAGFDEYVKTGNASEELLNAMQSISTGRAYRSNVLESFEDAAICTLCRVAARVLMKFRRLGVKRDTLVDIAKKICIWGRIENERVCNGVIDLNLDIFLYIVDNKSDLTPARVCSMLAQPNECHPAQSDGNWTINIPPPLTTAPSQKTAKPTDKPMRILQLTDIHYDDYYVEGGNVLCGEPLCCGSDQGPPKDPSAAAGPWGDYRGCDMPWYSVLNLLEHSSAQDYDIVYYTGDVIHHRVWQTSPESNTKDMKRLFAEFRRVFQDKPLYPIIGNHEPSPLDVFAPSSMQASNMSTNWLFDLMADEWSTWLPADTQETIKKGGFYTVLVKPGFRIIAINSNVAYIYNWWLMFDDKDPYGQLQWLTDILTQAEKDGEIVHILSHVPSGDPTCHKKWSHEYNRIIQRFAHIIATQINGHTHFDELNFFYNQSDYSQVISVAYNGGSFTTYTDVNPNYRIYSINPENMEVDDIENWTYNVTEANLHSVNTPPTWYKLYSFKEAYGLDEMTFDELGKLVKRMASDKHLLDTYYRFKVREADSAMEIGCDEKCHELNLCNIVTTEFKETKICDQLVSTFRKTFKS